MAVGEVVPLGDGLTVLVDKPDLRPRTHDVMAQMGGMGYETLDVGHGRIIVLPRVYIPVGPFHFLQTHRTVLGGLLITCPQHTAQFIDIIVGKLFLSPFQGILLLDPQSVEQIARTRYVSVAPALHILHTLGLEMPQHRLSASSHVQTVRCHVETQHLTVRIVVGVGVVAEQRCATDILTTPVALHTQQSGEISVARAERLLIRYASHFHLEEDSHTLARYRAVHHHRMSVVLSLAQYLCEQRRVVYMVELAERYPRHTHDVLFFPAILAFYRRCDSKHRLLQYFGAGLHRSEERRVG